MNNQAIIFDMDGVVSDTQVIHAQVESELLRSIGITLTPDEITKKYAGVSDNAMITDLLAHYPVPNPPPVSELITKKWQMTIEAATGNIQPIQHAAELVQAVKQNGFKVALASASIPEFIGLVLAELSLADYFDVVVSSQYVKEGKPAPDVFLLAAERLVVDPSRCIVIEDGHSGMIGAERAGMKCVGLVHDTNPSLHPRVTRLITSLSELSPELLRSL